MIDFETVSISELSDNLDDYLLKATDETAAMWLNQAFLFETAQRFTKALEQRRGVEQAKLSRLNKVREGLQAAKAAGTAPRDYRSQMGMTAKKLGTTAQILTEIDGMLGRLARIQPPPPLATFEKWRDTDGPIATEAEPLTFRPGPKRMTQLVERFIRGRVQFDDQKEWVG